MPRCSLTRHPSRLHRAVAAGIAATATVSCSQQDEVSGWPGGAFMALEPQATSWAPYSEDNNIALVADRSACVIDSFEKRVVCTTSEGRVIGSFGSEGEGPGEFLRPVRVTRVSVDTLAVFDNSLERLTYYEPTGRRLFEASLPPLFSVRIVRGTRVQGLQQGMPVDGRIATEQVELDVLTDSVLWSRDDMWRVPTDCGTHGTGIPTPTGGYVFVACQKDLVFFEHRDGEATVVTSPAYAPELPNERDVDAYLAMMARIGRGLVAPAAYEPYAAAYREDPKPWFVPDPFVFDELGRLWVATTRNLDRFSYIELWDGVEYRGTVRIPNRLIGYDILGSTLVALVEQRPDRNGVARRVMDWYDISEVTFEP